MTGSATQRRFSAIDLAFTGISPVVEGFALPVIAVLKPNIRSQLPTHNAMNCDHLYGHQRLNGRTGIQGMHQPSFSKAVSHCLTAILQMDQT